MITYDIIFIYTYKNVEHILSLKKYDESYRNFLISSTYIFIRMYLRQNIVI